MTRLQDEIIKQAGSQIGVREATGHNDGEAVEKYLKSVGLGKGYSWCMAFVYWCAKQAANKLNLINPLKQSGGVLDEWQSGRGTHIKVPEPGAIFIMDFGGGEGHTGIITGVFPEKDLLHTIEGNTNNDGSREGIGVFRKDRHISDPKIIGYIRLSDNSSTTT
jgi:hypothetical protein